MNSLIVELFCWVAVLTFIGSIASVFAEEQTKAKSRGKDFFGKK